MIIVTYGTDKRPPQGAIASVRQILEEHKVDFTIINEVNHPKKAPTIDGQVNGMDPPAQFPDRSPTIQ